MRTSGRTVLITGGSGGIGLALAKRFVREGSAVVVCGRRLEALAQAKAECPELSTIQCDVSAESERVALYERISSEHPSIDVLVNNAGIQNRLPPLTTSQDWAMHRKELATNLDAPMHLSMLFVPWLVQKESAAIVNVSSGLAFAPLAFMPTYCATKAAIHSFTMSLRYQLKDTSVDVVEMAPPAVDTDLGGKGLHTWGVPLDEFADHAFRELQKGSIEFGYQFSEAARTSSRAELDQRFAEMNARVGQR
jgi:uncharacterized oxidoreductase